MSSVSQGSTVPWDPRVWGGSLWKVLHLMAERYPVQPTHEHQQQAYNFFKSLGFMLPCGECQTHYQSEVSRCEFELRHAVTCRDQLAAYLIRFHNKVNVRLNKPSCMDVARTREKYRRVDTFQRDGDQGPAGSSSGKVSGEACAQRPFGPLVAAVCLGVVLTIMWQQRRRPWLSRGDITQQACSPQPLPVGV